MADPALSSKLDKINEHGKLGGLNERQADIMKTAYREGAVYVTQLSKHFRVTPQSIRRDLTLLVDAGLLRRQHGGAILADSVANLAYRARRRISAAAKQRIGAAAADAIPHNCSLFINIGTTTEAVARHLHSHHGLLVITNNINVANNLLTIEDLTLIIAGGAVRLEDGGIVGEMAEQTVARYKNDIAVIGVSAIDMDGDLLDFDHREVSIARAIMANSRRVFLVADSVKFTRRAPVRIGNIADIDVLITEQEPPPLFQRLCRRHKTDIIVAK